MIFCENIVDVARDDNFAPPYLTPHPRFTPCEFSPSCKGDGAGMGLDFLHPPCPTSPYVNKCYNCKFFIF